MHEPERSTGDRTSNNQVSRRRVLKASSALAGTAALAGCSLEGVGDALEELQEEAETAVFDPEAVDWWALRNMSHNRLDERDGMARNANLMMTEIGLDETSEQYYGVWHENILHEDMSADYDWVAEWDLGWDEFEAIDEDLADDYRLIDQAHYVLSDESLGDDGRCYAGIWIENPFDLEWAWTQHMGSGDAIDTVIMGYEADDLIPIDFLTYEHPVSGDLTYGCIGVENVEDLVWMVERDMTLGEFEDLNEGLKGKWRLIDLEAYSSGGTQYVTGIWVQNTDRDPTQGSQEVPDEFEAAPEADQHRHWDVDVNLSATGYADTIREMVDRGYRPISLSIYEGETGVEPRHAAVWRQDSIRPSWVHREDADDLITGFRLANDYPGVSVAIIKDGAMVYRRGFGYRHYEEGRRADSRTVYRLASVSKPIGAILGFRLQEKEDLELDDETSTYLPLGDDHEHTLEELLAHYACIPHYCESNDLSTWDFDHYASAEDAVEEFDSWDDEILKQPVELDDDENCSDLDPGEVDKDNVDLDSNVSTCVAGKAHRYSSAGYALLGAAYEDAAETTVDDLIRDELSVPYGLDSIRREDRRQADPHRARIYKDSGIEQTWPGQDDDEFMDWAKNGLLEEDSPPDDAGWQEQREYVDSNSWSVLGAGVEAHVTDLARMGQLLLDDELLDPDDREDMWEPFDSDIHSQRALGWRSGQHSGADVVWHTGSNNGGNATLRIYPDDDLVVAALTNRKSGDDQHVNTLARSLVTSLGLV